jgi:hypothetical protein
MPLEWLMRSPNELESRVLDPAQDTTIMHIDKLIGAAAASELSAAPASRAIPYSEEASVVAGKFLREHMAKRKSPPRKQGS